MYNVNDPRPEKKPFNLAEEATNLLIANIPFTIIKVTLEQFLSTSFGVQGIFILYVLCVLAVKQYRKVHNLKGSRKSVVNAVGWNILLFIIIPVIGLALNDLLG